MYLLSGFFNNTVKTGAIIPIIFWICLGFIIIKTLFDATIFKGYKVTASSKASQVVRSIIIIFFGGIGIFR